MKTLKVKTEQAPVELMSTMGCRTQNGADVNGGESYRRNVMSVIESGKPYDDFMSCAQKDGRGNICPVTVILPTIACEAIEETAGEGAVTDEWMEDNGVFEYDREALIDRFMELLDVKIHEAKDMLIERFNWICSQSADSAKFMYQNGTMAGYVPEEGVRSALRHGTLAMGQLGLAECLQLLIQCDQTDERGMALAKRIEQKFKDRCAEFKSEYKLNFGVYYTPEPLWAAV